MKLIAKLLVDAPTDKTVQVLVTLGVGVHEIVLERDFVDVVEGQRGVFVGVIDGDWEAEGGGAMQSGAMRLMGESHQ